MPFEESKVFAGQGTLNDLGSAAKAAILFNYEKIFDFYRFPGSDHRIRIHPGE
jgi:hypothetical protein